jgi:hypothetical protein
MNRYQIQATVTHEHDGWRTSTQLPTFFVNALTLDVALTRAITITNPHGLLENSNVCLTVYCEETGEYFAQK